jgi:hypothetical protein
MLSEVSGDTLPQSPELKSQTNKDAEKSEGKRIHCVTSQKRVILTIFKQVRDIYLCIIDSNINSDTASGCLKNVSKLHIVDMFASF